MGTCESDKSGMILAVRPSNRPHREGGPPLRRFRRVRLAGKLGKPDRRITPNSGGSHTRASRAGR